MGLWFHLHREMRKVESASQPYPMFKQKTLDEVLSAHCIFVNISRIFLNYRLCWFYASMYVCMCPRMCPSKRSIVLWDHLPRRYAPWSYKPSLMRECDLQLWFGFWQQRNWIRNNFIFNRIWCHDVFVYFEFAYNFWMHFINGTFRLKNKVII